MEALSHWQVPVGANQSVPIIFNLDHQQVIQTQVAVETQVVETQTLPWDETVHLAIQKYLTEKLSRLLDGRVRGNTCVHKQLLTLDDMLAIVVERHNALCLRDTTQDAVMVYTKEQNELEIAAIENFTETEAAALVMAELMSSQMVNAEQMPGTDSQVFEEVQFTSAAGSSHGDQMRVKKKKSAPRRPAGSSWQQLKHKQVQIIRCDPPEHIIKKEIEAQKLNSEGANIHGVSSSGMRRHVSAKKWFQCSECGMKLEDVSKLTRHVSKHSTDRPFLCSRCPRSYKTQDAVRKHISMVHDKARGRLFCQYCGRSFHHRKSRDEHVRIHTGEKPFKCTESGCNAAFNVQKTLVQHKKRRHNIGELIPCQMCNCKLESRCAVTKHMARIHKAQFPRPLKDIVFYQCLICHVEFQQCSDSMLVKHIIDVHGNPDCRLCMAREKRNQRIMLEAINRGMDAEAAKNTHNAQAWIKEEKEKRRSEKMKRNNEHLINSAIAKGMDKDKAQNADLACEWLKERNTGCDAKKYMAEVVKKKEEGQEVSEKDLMASAAGMTLEQLRKERVKSVMKEQELTKEVDKLKKRIYTDAMDVALEIIEDIDAEEVLGRGHRSQELAVIRAQFAVRQKEGIQQRTLVTTTAKRTVGLQTQAECGVNDRYPMEGYDGGRVIRFQENKAYVAMQEPVRPSIEPFKRRAAVTDLAENKKKVAKLKGQEKPLKDKEKPALDDQGTQISQIKNTPGSFENEDKAASSNIRKKPTPIQKKPATAKEDLKPDNLTIYSQSPTETLKMMQNKEITFVISLNVSQTQPIATHMKIVTPASPVLAFSNQIVIYTDKPELVKARLAVGKLNMKIAPLMGKDDDKLRLKSKSATALAENRSKNTSVTVQFEDQLNSTAAAVQSEHQLKTKSATGQSIDQVNAKMVTRQSVDTLIALRKSSRKRKATSRLISSDKIKKEDVVGATKRKSVTPPTDGESLNKGAGNDDDWMPEKMDLDRKLKQDATKKSSHKRKTVTPPVSSDQSGDDSLDEDDAEPGEIQRVRRGKTRKRGGRAPRKTSFKKQVATPTRSRKSEEDDLEPGEITSCQDVTGEETWKTNCPSIKPKKMKRSQKLAPELNLRKSNSVLNPDRCSAQQSNQKADDYVAPAAEKPLPVENAIQKGADSSANVSPRKKSGHKISPANKSSPSEPREAPANSKPPDMVPSDAGPETVVTESSSSPPLCSVNTSNVDGSGLTTCNQNIADPDGCASFNENEGDPSSVSFSAKEIAEENASEPESAPQTAMAGLARLFAGANPTANNDDGLISTENADGCTPSTDRGTAGENPVQNKRDTSSSVLYPTGITKVISQPDH